MRVVMASVLVPLFLFGCGKDEPKTSAADAPPAAASDASAGATASSAVPASSAAPANAAADPVVPRAEDAVSAAASTGGEPLSSSRSSPRLSSTSPAPASDAMPQTGGTKAASAQPGARSRDSAPSKAQYTIRRGDTLASIAKKHGLDAKDLARWNGIDDPRRLQIGQKIRLSAPAG
ncbi:MAG: LysM peptidoglycan-binding domain-containing protein [Burkholderiaceae bacterium]|nr:LysM peptidoglycan-binding domain-containing protein [Burkholderiaceae bacterium]